MPSDQITSLVEGIYDAALGVLPWENVLESLARLVKANSAAISVDFKRGSGLGILGGWGVSIGAADPAFHDSYFAHYGGINPLAERCLTAPSGAVLTDQMVMSGADYQRSEFYTDWARPQDFHTIMHLRVDNTDDAFIGVGLTRSRHAGEFDASDIAIQTRLAPHFRRGIRTHLRLAEVQAAGLAMGEALDRMQRGAIGLDRSSRIVFANQAAQSLLRKRDTLQAAGSVVVAAHADWTGALQRMIDLAIRGRTAGSMTLPRPDGRPALIVEALPIPGSAALTGNNSQPVVFLILTDPADDRGPASALLCKYYGLTAREAEVAVLAARGEGLAAVAAALGMARSTAQSHLKKVFDKTETHRQAELAWLVARLSG